MMWTLCVWLSATSSSESVTNCQHVFKTNILNLNVLFEKNYLYHKYIFIPTSIIFFTNSIYNILLTTSPNIATYILPNCISHIQIFIIPMFGIINWGMFNYTSNQFFLLLTKLDHCRTHDWITDVNKCSNVNENIAWLHY